MFTLDSDMLTLAIGLVLSVYFFRDYQLSRKEWAILSGFILIWLIMQYGIKYYYLNYSNKFQQTVVKHVQAYSILILLVSLLYFSFPELIDRNITLAIIIGYPVLGITIVVIGQRAKQMTTPESKKFKYTLVAGVGKVAKNVEQELYTNHVSGYKIKGFINCLKNEECAVGKEMVVGDLKDIHQLLKSNPIDEIVIALPGNPYRKIQNILMAADYHGVRVKYIPDYGVIFGRNYKVTRYGHIDAVNIRQLPLDNKVSAFLKDCFDKGFSIFILLLLLPFFVLLAVLIKLETPGPVFYCPTRVGKGGRSFKVFKFRSMRTNDDSANGILSTKANDPRITKLGKILRRYSIDELPQFLNVLKGEMSIIGPRPHRSFLNQQFQVSIYRYMTRHYIKPGITGWAQVNGWRGPTDTEEQKRQRTLHDLWYLENWSFWLDFKILFLTVFSRKAHDKAF
jgi:putative colanic acid biosynthesis UDP-glucose lipid carrier transferase